MMKKTAQCMLPFLLLLITNCTHDKQKVEILAYVGDRVVTVDEFIQRAEFSPERLALEKQLNKRQLLEILIDEKLLAIEAENQQLEQTPKVKHLSQFIEDLAILRLLFKKEVQSNVKLDPAQVEHAIAYSQQERVISFCSFKEEPAALKYHKKWKNSSLQKILQEIEGEEVDTLLNQRSIKWGENDTELDAAIFGLQIGDISHVLEQNGTFVIVRCDDIKQNALATATHYAAQKSKVKRILAARQETQLSKEFVSRFMQQQNVKFDEKRVRQIIETLVNLLFSDKSPTDQKMMEIPVSEPVWQQASTDLSATQEYTMVSYKNGALTVGEFMQKWRAYRFHVDKSDRAACVRSLNDQFSLVIRDVLLAREGRRLGLEMESSVQRDVILWRDFYLAELVAAGSEKKEIDALLAPMRKKSAITVNENLLQTVELTDIPVIAMRPGQYASRVTPPWPSFINLEN